jgi:protein SCO1/2
MRTRGKIRTLLSLIFIGGLLLLSFDSIYAQGAQHYNSPLYSPKTYDPSSSATSNGLPETLKNIGIEQRLGEQLPLGTELTDENGDNVKLQTFFQGDKPVVLAFVYYSCPMLCNEVLNGLTASLKKISLEAGEDFEVVAVSFDPRDTPEIARHKKQSYLERYGRGEEGAAGWHFLTGEPEVIKRITEAAGFNYAWDEETEQFAHAGGVQIVTPDGKLSKYFYGIDYDAQDLKFALMEASEKTIGSPTDRLLLYCYHYDPATGKYGLVILKVLRVAGVLTIIGIGALFLTFKFYKRRRAVD